MAEVAEKRGTGLGAGSGLELRKAKLLGRGKRAVWLRAVFVLALCLYPRHGHVSTPAVGVAAFCVLLYGIVLTGHFRLRAKGVLVRLNAQGVTVAGEPTVPWRELRKVEVVHRGRLVAFVPRVEGTVLPIVPRGIALTGRERQEKLLIRKFGSTLTISPAELGSSVAQVTEAVRRYSRGVPVFDDTRDPGDGKDL